MIKPTKTINKIHFEDLNDKRFEDLCNNLIYPLNPWDEITHIGRAGRDHGVDILAKEKLENGNKRIWFIQCKRYKKITVAELKKTVDEALKNRKAPDVFLVIAGCNMSEKIKTSFLKYAEEKNINEPKLWMASDLEAMLYNQRQDLLFAYFGISLSAEGRKKEAVLKKNIKIKKSLHVDLLSHNFHDYAKYFSKPNNDSIEQQEIIIHSIDDIDYPIVDKFRPGISSWYRGWFFGFYYNGIEIASHPQRGLINQHDEWSLTEENDFDEKSYQKILCLPCLRIPYKNIVAYDMLGDEYYCTPHIYCRFSEGGQPHEKVVYRKFVKDQFMPILEDNKRFFI